MLEVVYSPLLVFGSLAVAIMGAFTALRLTSNLRNLDLTKRKVRVAQGALALGTGIWSMHFIGMLAVEMPITINYDPVRTLASALIAVLVVGVALLSLHFGIRTKARIYIAGTLMGLGIVGMHYLGMSAISSNSIITYSPIGVLLAIATGIASSIAAIELAYGNRSPLKISTGSVVLGLAISAMHYSAMYFTVFTLAKGIDPTSASFLDREQLALLVVLSSFVLCGLFLLMAVPNDNRTGSNAEVGEKSQVMNAEFGSSDIGLAGIVKMPGAPLSVNKAGDDNVKPQNLSKIPYERNKVVRYLDPDAIHIVKADGHYTSINDGENELFCPWSISRMEESLGSVDFMRIHRSFIVKKTLIAGFRRAGDKAFCVVGVENETEIPISRSRISEFRNFLQLI